MRGRSYSLSPPPRGGYGRRRSPSPRGRFDGRGGGGRGNSGASDAPTSLLVRNLRRDCRQEDLRRPFAQFGLVKDIYLPRDYYTGEPRGFGFVQFVDPTDAADAKYHMDGQVLQGRQLTVVFAEENRKKPTDMRARERGSSHRGRVNDRRRSPPPRGGGGGGGYSRSPRGGGGGGYSRSPPPRNARSRSPGYSPPPKRREQHSRSISPQEKAYSRERVIPRHSRERSYSRSPPPGREHPPAVRERSPPPYEGGGVRNRGGRSPVRGEASPIRGESRSPSRSRSRSIDPADYSREPGTGRID